MGDNDGIANPSPAGPGGPTLELVTDVPRTAERRRVAECVEVELPAGLSRRVDDLCAESDVDGYTVLLAVFHLLMGRYGAVSDVSVVATAPAGDGDEQPGVLLVRCSWDDDPPFATVLRRVRAATAAGRTAGAHGAPGPATVAFGGDRVPTEHSDIAVRWTSPGARAEIHYDASLFGRATIERVWTHYTALLASATTDPGSRVSALVHTTPDERALLATWGTDDSDGRPRSLLDGFRRQAERSPDAVALMFDDAVLTYGELRDRAERFAEALTGRGIGPGHVVGLAIDRSASLVVAMLGAVTAGAAYLPLDLEYPDARLEFMAADSGAALVVTDRELGWTPAAPVVMVRELAAAAGPAGPAVAADHPDDVACVLYTSGSSGLPKGVATTHRGIVRLVCDAPFFPCAPADAVAQASSPSFDSASLEIWGALLNGARLVGIPKDEVLSIDRLGARIETHGITAMFLPTSVFHVHADVYPGVFAGLRALYFGGEPADARRVAAVRAAAPGVRLVNGYGPTECTTFASTFDADGSGQDEAGLPIGRPIPETTLYVLDSRLRVSGVGVPGELYIGGSGLARGYLGRPALTAERFVASPFGDGQRLYRTGDVARWREDGLLECRGRVDTQVKVRGVRIEPEEVASVLGTHPEVRSSVVDVHGEDDAKSLVAYFVPLPGVSPDRGRLRSYLADRLPVALVPTWFVPLPELPLTPNGKVDRRALPAPGDEDAARSSSHVLPRDEVEETIAAVWAKVLDVADLSVEDDFLALGGNSLLATRVAAQLGARLGVRLGVRDLFEAPTVAALAARVAGAGRARDDVPLVAQGQGPHPLSCAQERMWFLDRMAQGTALYNVPLALTLRGELDVPALAAAVRSVVGRHAALRTVLVSQDAAPRQQVRSEVDVPLQVDDLRALPHEDVAAEFEAQAAHEARTPFDLATGPLIRCRLVRLSDTHSELLITMHHAICDGWSVGVLLDDLGAYYAAGVSGRDAALPELPFEYADFAAWQRRLLDSGARDAQLAYWTDTLRDAPPVLSLPTDRPRPAEPRHAGDSLPLRMPADLTKLLVAGSQELGVTPFTCLLGAFHLLMGHYAGVRDVCVATPVSGRTRQEFDGMVGCFINTLVLRVDWTDEMPFAEFLSRVRTCTLAAYDRQDLPLEDIVSALNPPRVVGVNPFAQVMVAMQNIPDTTDGFPGLSVAVREQEQQAKLDLVLRWAENPGAAGELTGFAEYNVDLFDESTVAQVVSDFYALLEAGLRSPDAAVSATTLGITLRARADDQPGQDQADPPVAREQPAVADPVETAIASVWREVLGLASVTADDNFFDVGGTSLLALRVQAGLEQSLGRKIPVVDLFRFPTVARLARHLADTPAQPPAAVAPRPRVGRRRTTSGARPSDQDSGAARETGR